MTNTNEIINKENEDKILLESYKDLFKRCKKDELNISIVSNIFGGAVIGAAFSGVFGWLTEDAGLKSIISSLILVIGIALIYIFIVNRCQEKLNESSFKKELLETRLRKEGLL